MPVLEPFTPSIDWSHAVPDSTAHTSGYGLISAVCVLVVLVVLRFTTHWARQYWRITGRYFSGPGSVRVWLMLSVLLLFVVTTVRINVLLSYFRENSSTDALEIVFTGSGAQNESSNSLACAAFWETLIVFRIPGPQASSPWHHLSIPDAALHHRVADLADRAPHHRLVNRTRLLPGQVHRCFYRQPGRTHPAGRRHFHHRRGRHHRCPDHRHVAKRSAVRRCALGGLGGPFAFILWNLSGVR